MTNRLIEAGALRQFLSNTGEGSYIAAYDLEITNRLLAHLEIEKGAQGARIEQDARIIEILRAQVKRMEEQQNAHRPDFLLNGARFKLNFSSRGNTDVFHNYAAQLQGRWVALVPAEDDGHLASPPTIDTPEFQRLLDEVYGTAADARQLGNDHGTADALSRAESKLIEHINTRIEAEVERRFRAQGGNTSKASAESDKQEARDAGWISVAERLPEVGEVVLVYTPPMVGDWPDDVRIDFDCIDPDADEPTSWRSHNEHYEHYCCVATDGMTGPSEKAPYTHWMPLPAAPLNEVPAPTCNEEKGESK